MAASSRGDHKCLGSKSVTVNEMSQPGFHFNIGTTDVEVERFELKPVVNFLEYIFGGCNLNLVVAIDFTGSNG